MAQGLHEQPCRIAARTGAEAEALFAGLDAGLEADRVPEPFVHHLVDLDEEIDDAFFIARNAGEKLGEQGTAFRVFKIGQQFLLQLRRVGKREFLGVILDKKIEWIDHHHVGDDIDLDGQFGCRFREHQAGEEVTKRILLPVDEVFGRFDVQRIGKNGGAAMGGGFEPDGVRGHHDRAVVVVTRLVVEGGPYAHKSDSVHGLPSMHDTNR